MNLQDLLMNPESWDVDAVERWFKATFNLPEETLVLLKENDVDGSILVNDIDHRALKDEFGLKSFGVRCNILKEIAKLRATCIKEEIKSEQERMDSLLPPGVSNLNGLDLQEATFTRDQSKETTTNDRTFIFAEHTQEIPLLAQPLEVWRDDIVDSKMHHSSRRIKRSQTPEAISLDESDGEDDKDEEDEEQEDEEGDSDLEDIYLEYIDHHSDSDLPLAVRLETSRKSDTKAKSAVPGQHSFVETPTSQFASSSLTTGVQKAATAVSSTLSSVHTKRIVPTAISTGIPQRAIGQKPTFASNSSSPALATNASPKFQRITPTFVSPFPTPQDLEPAIHPSPGLRSQSMNDTISSNDHIPNSSSSPKSTRVFKSRPSKQHYLTQARLSMDELFWNKHGAALESSSDDEWSITASRPPRKSVPAGYRSIVQRNLKRILREPPIFEASGQTIYAPLRRRAKDVPVKIISTREPGAKVEVKNSTWDSVFKDQKNPTSLRVELTLGEHDMSSIDFRTFTRPQGTTHTTPLLAPDDDPIYPLYGDSDASAYTTDEELYKEVAKEEKEKLNKLSRRDRVLSVKTVLSSETVREIIEQYTAEYMEQWNTLSRPHLQRNVYKIYRQLMYNGSTANSEAELMGSVRQLEGTRLPSIIEAFMDTAYRTRAEVRKACAAMDRTLDQLAEQQWKLELIRGPAPSPDIESGQESGPDSEIDLTEGGLSSESGQKKQWGRRKRHDKEHDELSTEEERELEEERRQRELDDDFIDDSEMYVDYESEVIGNGDLIMSGRPAPRRRKKPSTKPIAAKSGFKKLPVSKPADKDDEMLLLSLPSPPSTSASPKDEQQSAEVNPSQKEEDDKEDETLYIRRKGSRKHRQDSSQIGLSDENVPLSVKRARKPSHDVIEPRSMYHDQKARASSPVVIELDDSEPSLPESPAEGEVSSANQLRKSSPSTLGLKEEVAQQDDAEEDQLPTDRTEHADETIEESMDVEAEPDSETSEIEDTDLPSLAPIKKLRTSNWRAIIKNQMDDMQLEKKVRAIRKDISLGRIARAQEPYISVWQEYVEWIELDCGDTISFREFLKWKDDGNNTMAYREKAREAAAAQAKADRSAARQERKERKEREVREKKEKMEREKKEKVEREKKKKVEREKKEKVEREKKEKVEREKEKEEEKEREMQEKREEKSDKPKVQNEKKRPSGKVNSIIIHSEASSDEGPKITRKVRPKPKGKGTTSTAALVSSDRSQRSTARSKAIRGEEVSTPISGLGSVEKDGITEDGSNPDAATAASPTLGLKKRSRRIRNRFGDTSEGEAWSSEEGEEKEDQSKRRSKRKAAMPMKDESEEVLRLRKDAAKNELELQKRIKEQEMRAKIRGTTLDPLKGDEVLINPGHKKTEHPVIIPPFLVKNLKPHQIDGVRFMWKNIVMFDGGCILAHNMGLGKSFQVVAFVYVLLRELHAGNKDIPEKLQAGRVLLLVPPIVLQNWEDEFQKWLPYDEQHVVQIRRFSPKTKSVSSRIVLVEEWYRDGGVFILGYGMFRELCVPRGGQGSEVGARYRELFQDGPSLIIADEGHNLKNAQAKLATAANNLKSTARVILTGHPLQNRLEEYWCMVDFVRPNFLGDIATFRHNYIRPINEGLYPDSSIFEKKASAKKLKVLTELIKNFVMRKDSSVLKATLPKKVEFVVSCKLSTMQYYLYTSFLPTLDPTTRAVLGNGYCLLTICNHPAVFKATLFEMMRRKKADKTVAASSNDTKAISAVDSPTTAVPESLADAVGEDSGDETTKEAEQALSQNASVLSNHWSGSFIQEKSKSDEDEYVNDISHSYKIKILMDILQACRDVNEKVLVFSRSIPTLDYIERITKEAGFWSMRLDGDTPIVDRQNMINTFNTSAKYHLFLISSNAGSLGVNLVSASRVVIFDVGWNPSHDEQAIARAFRYGQKRKVFVYRLQTFGTWEDKLYKTNLHKLGLSTRVVDKKNMIKSYTKTEMTKYFEQPPETTPVWASQENVDTLFTRPDTDDPVLRSVIDSNRETIASVALQSDLVREEDSDLTEADMVEIQNMIAEEQRRIDGHPPLAPTVPALAQMPTQQQQQIQQQLQQRILQQQYLQMLQLHQQSQQQQQVQHQQHQQHQQQHQQQQQQPNPQLFLHEHQKQQQQQQSQHSGQIQYSQPLAEHVDTNARYAADGRAGTTARTSDIHGRADQ
ncbi:hypothetical protein BGZ54_007692 [Gamsiella multidivaricata]|nr:hypothetical protein BGZ54_007692 [Gamsiella multidivaricata]